MTRAERRLVLVALLTFATAMMFAGLAQNEWLAANDPEYHWRMME